VAQKTRKEVEVKARKKVKGEGLWKRRRRREYWSIFNNSKMRC